MYFVWFVDTPRFLAFARLRRDWRLRRWNLSYGIRKRLPKQTWRLNRPPADGWMDLKCVCIRNFGSNSCGFCRLFHNDGCLVFLLKS